MMLARFKKMAGDIICQRPRSTRSCRPRRWSRRRRRPTILEMDLHLARIDGQMRSSWIVEPADGQMPFTDAGKKA